MVLVGTFNRRSLVAAWDHWEDITGKARRTLGFVQRNLRSCPSIVKERAYFTLVRPSLEYACSVWSPHSHSGVEEIERIQRVAARFVSNKPHMPSTRDSITAILRRSLEERRRRSSLVTFYKMLNNLVAIPVEYHPAPKPSHHRTRGHSLQLAQQHTNLTVFRGSFIPRMIPLWNSLPEDVASAPSADAFKQRLSTTSTRPEHSL